MKQWNRIHNPETNPYSYKGIWYKGVCTKVYDKGAKTFVKETQSLTSRVRKIGYPSVED
jgi:hypothetical protein